MTNTSTIDQLLSQINSNNIEEACSKLLQLFSAPAGDSQLLSLEIQSILLNVDSENFLSSNAKRIKLIQILFTLVSSAYSSGTEESPPAATTTTTTLTAALDHKAIVNIISVTMPFLLWSLFSLPRPKHGSDDQKETELIKGLQAWIDAVECCLVSYYRYFTAQSAKEEKLAHETTSNQRIEELKSMLTASNKRPSIFCRKLPAGYQNTSSNKDSNPNLSKSHVFHYLPDPAMFIPSLDDSIVSATPVTKPAIVEGLLRIFCSLLKQDISVDLLMVMMMFIERILCTGYENSPVQFAPDISSYSLKFLHMPIQKFHRSSTFIWRHISESFHSIGSPLSPIPSTKLMHRFSVSSAYSITASNTRKFSEAHQQANIAVLASPWARPFTAQSSFSNAPFPITPQPPMDKRLNMSQASLSSKQLSGVTVGAASSVTTSQIAAVATSAASANTTPNMVMDNSNIVHSPIRMTMKSTLPVEFDPRMTITRESFRLILSILQFCQSYYALSSKLKEKSSAQPQQVDLDYQGIWKDLIPPSTMDTATLNPSSSTHSLNTNAEMDSMHTAGSRNASSTNLLRTISSVTTEMKRPGTIHLPINSTTDTQAGNNSGLRDSFKTLLTRASQSLYFRSTYEMLWEISMGSRCLLMEMSQVFENLVLADKNKERLNNTMSFIKRPGYKSSPATTNN